MNISDEMESIRREHITDEALARCVHELHRAYSWWIFEPGFAQPEWDDLSDWARETVVIGVRMARMGAPPESIHKAWADRMKKDGWVYGKERNSVIKTHPAIRDWAELPVWERRKTIALCRIVFAFTLEEW